MRIGRDSARGVTLVVVVLAVLFVIGEIVCRLFIPDTRLRYVSDPEALYRLAPNHVGTSVLASGALAPPARINTLGFRGGEPAAGRPSIVILGDSFTFGSGVADDETFAARLDQWYGGRVSVMNGGHPGYGVFQMAATLRRVGEELRPRLVVVVVWQGDFLRQPPDADERARFMRRLQVFGALKNSVLGTHLYRRMEPLLAQVGRASLVVRAGEGGGGSEASTASVREAHIRGVQADAPRLLAIHQEASRYGKGLLIVLWPKKDFASVPEAERGLAQELTVVLEAFAQQHEVPFISMQPAMRRVTPKDRLLIPNDWHPTPLAHCLAAEQIGVALGGLGFPPLREGT